MSRKDFYLLPNKEYFAYMKLAELFHEKNLHLDKDIFELAYMIYRSRSK